MKILQVQTQAEAAGAQRISDMVGEGLRARGHEVTTVYMYRKTDIYDNDPHAIMLSHSSPRNAFDQARAALALIKYVRKFQPAALITYQYWGNVFGAMGAKLAGTPLLIANQSGAPMTGGLLGIASRLDKLIGNRGWYHHNIVNSTWTLQQFENYPPHYQKALHLIDHGVQVSVSKLNKTEARQKFNLPQNKTLLVSTGRLTAPKNQILLARCLADLPDVHLALVGIGPAEEEIRQTVRKAGTENRLHLLGEILPSDIPGFLAAADIFAFPSRFETFGLAVVEAAMAGVPVVANDLDVLREVLRTTDGQPAALFASAQDRHAFTRQIKLLMKDPKLAQTLSTAGQALGEKYSVEAMCQAYEDLLATS